MEGRHGRAAVPLVVCVAVFLLAQAGGLPSSGAAPAARAGVAVPSVSAEIRLGYGGYVTPDLWIPLVATLRSDRDLRGILEVAAPHPRSPRAARTQVEVHLSSGSRSVTVPVVVRDLRAPLTVSLFEGGRVAGQWRVVAPPTHILERVVLALADRPVGLDRLLPAESRMRVAYVDPGDLPARWQLYEGVRAVVIRNLEERRVTPTQRDALSGWVAAGGHLVLVAPEGGDLLSGRFARAFLESAPRPPAPGSAPERVYPWGRGTVTVVPVDPFVPDLSPERVAVWTRVLARGEAASLVDRTLFEALPQSGGASPLVQLLIVLLLAGYLIALRPLSAMLRRGASGAVLAAMLLAAVAAGAGVLAMVARAQMRSLLQGAVGEGLLGRDLARVEALGRVTMPRGGAFLLRSGGGALIRPLAESDTTLRLAGEVSFQGRTAVTLPVQSSALVPLPVAGSFREEGQQLTVTIRNRTGALLRDPVIFHQRRVHAIASVGPEATAVLSGEGWRDPPPFEGARHTQARLLAWTLGRLRDGAIIEPTAGAATFLLAWLDDEAGGVLRWKERESPLLVVVPLTGMSGSP
ncbi:MAG TPA: hypothetical protein VGR25_00615 [bacterium]|nr:hypothetical protein [bacterium]